EDNKAIMKAEAVLLNAARRQATESAIRSVCEHKEWRLRAANVRTNHAHVVVSTCDRNPHKALNAFKPYATRRMRAEGCWDSARSPWSDKGSERWLWDELSVANACDYVLNGQGGDLSEFDGWRVG